MDITEYRRVIRQLLGDYRFHHSICVSEAAVELAKVYGADPEKAQMAGTLHDVMKDIPHDEQMEKMREYNIHLTTEEQYAPKLWHAILGEAYLRNVLGIIDPEILGAVRYHTTGKAGMTLMEQIVFTADFISADRTYDGVEKFRKTAKKNLTQVMHQELAYTIAKLAKDGVPIHPDTLAAYNEISIQIISQKKG
ncbi:MAG: bis(5'-nucleosyl)-tetraphosphatase (symmetrical) YqeK [Oscillospiraceae bacterium]|nr:bis(5'-nucleosyl)-tetraphosphatase (symmetrical) YqeK [Oscillospiraceae bacterium]